MNTKRTVSLMLVTLGMFLASVANAAPPAKAAPVKDATAGMVLTATCNDGKDYYSKTGEHRGACSGHGGVASWADGSEVKSKGRKTAYK
jgi:hypothetical protein